MVIDHNSHGDHASTVLYPTADWSTVHSHSNNSLIHNTNGEQQETASEPSSVFVSDGIFLGVCHGTDVLHQELSVCRLCLEKAHTISTC